MIRYSESYCILQYKKRNYQTINLIHKALSDAFEKLAFEYAIKIARDNDNKIPLTVEVDIIKLRHDLQVRLTVDEIEYEDKD